MSVCPDTRYSGTRRQNTISGSPSSIPLRTPLSVQPSRSNNARMALLDSLVDEKIVSVLARDTAASSNR